MPTYQYRCVECSTELEAVQKFTDDPLTDCPDCTGSLRKVYSAVGVVFKGPGFYATDNRSKGKANAAKPAPVVDKPATAATSSSTSSSPAA
ncbi:MAG: zinc ribbon domain-containing protein [Propionibacteriaceae bacterium]|nr:zinc ribbon domain-containing protein [Propionibacteriaceae bacterium]